MSRAILGLILFFFCIPTVGFAVDAIHRAFSQFSVDLPPGWDGEEQSGFISDNKDEYLLTLGKKDDKGDNFIAQVSIYLLPNKPGVDSATAAKTLAEAQGEASVPIQKGNFQVFTGEPRTRALKGMATTMVNASPQWLLIIIAQDPQACGSEQIIASLTGETAEAKTMLGH